LTAADAFAVLPLIRTLPASQASFATVRLLISLETFKNLSSLIVISPFADKKKTAAEMFRDS